MVFVLGCGIYFILFYLLACEACAQDVGDWLYLFYQVVFVLGRSPSSYILGEVLSVFHFFWCLFGFMNYSWFFVGLFPFGNKFLIIEKKKKIALCYVVAAIYCLIVSFVTNEFA